MANDLLAGIRAGTTRVVDLTYALSEKNPAWPGDVRPFEARINATAEKHGYFTRSFAMLEHFGTHLDAPVHFPPGKQFVDQIPAERLFGAAVVLEAREESQRDADYQLSADRIAAWEARHGRIPPGAIAMMRTGWGDRWPDAARYRNMDASGTMHFPGFSVAAARLLIERGVSGLGIDTMGVDRGSSKTYDVHHLALPAGLYQLENLANLQEVPEAGAFLVVAPIKMAGGSGGPCRVFAILQ
jgi:kynurenine formamidase